MRFSLPPQDVPLVDPRTGLIDKDWYDKLRLAETVITGSQKLIAFSRVMNLASGNQVVTGVGFTPRLIQWQTALSGGGSYCSTGISDGATSSCLEVPINAVQPYAGIQRDNTTPLVNYNFFNLVSFDADGFTIAWSKNGAPAAFTATCQALCFR